MKKAMIHLMILTAGVWPGTAAWAQETNPRPRDFVYGYAPERLTGTDTDIATTAEEEGHYIEGYTDRPPEPALEDVPAAPQRPAPVSADNTDRVLISEPRPPPPEPRPTTQANQRSAQINDSRDIDRQIEQHRWTVPF